MARDLNERLAADARLQILRELQSQMDGRLSVLPLQRSLDVYGIRRDRDWIATQLRKLEALLAVADETASFIITGNGDVVQPENDLIAIGSGGNYAQAAATALLANTDLSAKDIAEKSLTIAGDICVFTNHHQTVEVLDY